MFFLYKIFIYLYTFGIKLTAPFNNKARLWVEGRKGIFEQLAEAGFSGQRIIWVHCASLGEFEQGRPLIEAIKQQTTWKVLLTFFSPSGYELRKGYDKADWVFYLPADLSGQPERFLKIVQPRMAIFVKYEFWFGYWQALQRQKIPILLVSAVFRPSQFFFKKMGVNFLNILKKTYIIFVQDKASFDLLERTGFTNQRRAGDTRVDRVLQIAENTKPIAVVEDFLTNGNALAAVIFGSLWASDLPVVAPFILKNDNKKYIIAPHDISEKTLETIENQFVHKKIVRYSRATTAALTTADILLIDNIGLLSSIYRYGRVAYIGGGFGKGIHNTLEPITFGLPVIFGTRHQKFMEAKQLKTSGGGFAVQSANDFENIMKQLEDNTFWRVASEAAYAYLAENKGATDLIMRYIIEKFGR